ncbi:hypothetical protein HK096_006210 [Nowakowskiella sp. JEL0078]|nr:hypothetical protein HK096_006210 [Nowakowskiella sp. JEL0078]
MPSKTDDEFSQMRQVIAQLTAAMDISTDSQLWKETENIDHETETFIRKRRVQLDDNTIKGSTIKNILKMQEIETTKKTIATAAKSYNTQEYKDSVKSVDNKISKSRQLISEIKSSSETLEEEIKRLGKELKALEDEEGEESLLSQTDATG